MAKKKVFLKYITIVIYIISAILLCIAMLDFSKELTILKVTEKNREYITNSLNKNIPNSSNITKIELGNGFHSGQLIICYKNGSRYSGYITEGMFKNQNIEQYIRANGYSLDNVAIILIAISAILLIISIFLKHSIKNKN